MVLAGLGFSPTSASNTVLFKSASATTGAIVTSAATASLTVTVPNDAVCGPVNVTVGTQTTENRMVIITGTTCALQLTDILGNAAPGETLVLEGAGFDAATPANNVVKFAAAGGGTVNATVLQSGGTQIQVRVPDSAIQGNVTVTVGAATSNAIPYTP